jgi:hypothetical protein
MSNKGLCLSTIISMTMHVNYQKKYVKEILREVVLSNLNRFSCSKLTKRNNLRRLYRMKPNIRFGGESDQWSVKAGNPCRHKSVFVILFRRRLLHEGDMLPFFPSPHGILLHYNIITLLCNFNGKHALACDAAILASR